MTTTTEHLTERDYIRHEIDALFAAQDRGDQADVRLTAVTLQQILHIIGLGAGDVGETCGRIYTSNGSYQLPDRERERHWAEVLSAPPLIFDATSSDERTTAMTMTTHESAAKAPEWATSSVPFDDGRLYYGPSFGDLQVSQGPTESAITVSTGDTLGFNHPQELRKLAADALAAAEWLEALQ